VFISAFPAIMQALAWGVNACRKGFTSPAPCRHVSWQFRQGWRVLQHGAFGLLHRDA
jgi:hypothetical protein